MRGWLSRQRARRRFQRAVQPRLWPDQGRQCRGRRRRRSSPMEIEVARDVRPTGSGRIRPGSDQPDRDVQPEDPRPVQGPGATRAGGPPTAPARTRSRSRAEISTMPSSGCGGSSGQQGQREGSIKRRPRTLQGRAATRVVAFRQRAPRPRGGGGGGTRETGDTVAHPAPTQHLPPRRAGQQQHREGRVC